MSCADDDDDGPTMGQCARLMRWLREACSDTDVRGFDAMPLCRFAHLHRLHAETPAEVYRQFVMHQTRVYEFAARHMSERVLNAMSYDDRERFFYKWQSVERPRH